MSWLAKGMQTDAPPLSLFAQIAAQPMLTGSQVEIQPRDNSLCLVSPSDSSLDSLASLLSAISGVSKISRPTEALPGAALGLTPSEAALRLMAQRNPNMVVIDLREAPSSESNQITICTGGAVQTAKQQRMSTLLAELSTEAGLRCEMNNAPAAEGEGVSLTRRARDLFGLTNVLQINVPRNWRQATGKAPAPLLGVLGNFIQHLRLG